MKYESVYETNDDESWHIIILQKKHVFDAD